MPPPLAISTCWNSHRHTDGAALLEELAGLGFSDVELGHGIRFSLWPGILDAVKNKTVRIVSLHNFCPLPMGFTHANPNCLEFSDPQPAVRRRAVKSTLETLRHAAALGARAVVLHLGSTNQPTVTGALEELLERRGPMDRRFRRLKLQAVLNHEHRAPPAAARVRACLDTLVPEARSLGLRLGLECRESIEEYPLDEHWEEILRPYPGDTVGYWHDFGHAARKHALGFIDHAQLLQRLGPRLVACHVHDFQPPAADHRPLGAGTIPFASLWPSCAGCNHFVLELSPRLTADDVKSSLQWWRNNGPQDL